MIKHLLKLVWNRKRANALIVAEIFVSFLVVFTVLTGAVTLFGGWLRPIGFDYANVWDVRLELDGRHPEERDPQLHATVMRMLDEARSFPEVESAAVSATPALSFSRAESSRTVDGRKLTIVHDEVSDEFRDVMRLEVVRGRWFSAEDDAAQLQPVVLDTNAARTLFGDADPVGRIVEDGREAQFRVVGVVNEFRKDGEVGLPLNMTFRRLAPDGRYGILGNHILVRLRPGTPAGFEEQLITRLQQVAPEISMRVRHMDQMHRTFLRMRMAPIVIGAVVGTFLIAMVTLGLTGVLWQNVTRRTREIGLRRAMGASGPGVRTQILVEVALLTTVALVAGLVVAIQLPILGMFKLVTPAAFATGLAAAIASIYGLTLLCGLYPSWLASRLEPADALRYE